MRIPVAISLLLPMAIALGGELPLRDVIDKEIEAALEREGIQASGQADDATFLRRVYLDLLGMVPTYGEAQKFLDNDAPDKRLQLVNSLMEDPRHARHQRGIWDLLIFTRKPANPSFTKDRGPFKEWLEKQFAQNVHWDELVRKLILAEEPGSQMFHVQYRNKPEDETVAVSRLFLGTQLQCARCHDHPFEELSQEDFYGMAGFFVRLQVLEEKKGKVRHFHIGEKSSGEVMFTGPASEATPGKKGEPVKAKFLDGTALEEPELPEDFEEPDYKKIKKPPFPEPFFSRKAQLATWLTSPDNPYFAKAAVNRVWAQFMGRGLVHPVDDLKPGSRASHPELLETLAKEFIAHEYDLRWLAREILMSAAYQRDSAGAGKEAFPKWYDRARVRPLSAEELIASFRVASGFDVAEGKDKKMPNAAKDYMTRIFGTPEDGRGNFQGGIHEHLYLNNGSQLRGVIRAKEGNLADSLLKDESPWPDKMQKLFLSTVTRFPTDAEKAKVVEYITHTPDDKRATQERLEEAIWALLSSSRFRFNY